MDVKIHVFMEKHCEEIFVINGVIVLETIGCFAR